MASEKPVPAPTRVVDDETVYRDYPNLMQTLAALVRPLQLLPLQQMQWANERMQTMAPFFAPPLTYHRGAQNLADQRRIIDAAAALQRVVLELLEAFDGQ